MLNFAQGEMGLFGTFVAWQTLTSLHANYYLAVLAGIAAAAALGMAIELIGTTPLALPTQDSPGVNHWKSPGTPAPAANFDLQDYATAKIFFEIVRRSSNNLTWGHFIKTAIAMKSYKTGIVPPVTFAPYSKKQIGSRVQNSAEVAVYNDGTWTAVTGFLSPKQK